MTASQQILVFGNEKGGTGKSTLAVHVAIELLYRKKSVLCIDCDGRQGTLSRYLENRQHFLRTNKLDLPQANWKTLDIHRLQDQKDQESTLNNYLAEASEKVIIVDTPGSYNTLSSYVHSIADLLITPLNESFIDLDLLMKIMGDVGIQGMGSAGSYGQEVWGYKMNKAASQKKSIDWLVVKNRESSLRSKNKIEIEKIFRDFSKKLGFRFCGGFKEKAIFRQLFPQGLTVSDYGGVDRKLISVSHITARKELRKLMQEILKSPSFQEA